MAGPEPNGNRRIVDLIVEEVSVVDRAANRRRFLIVKRDEMKGHDELIKALTELPEYASGFGDDVKAAIADALRKALEGIEPKPAEPAVKAEPAEPETEPAAKAEPETEPAAKAEAAAKVEPEVEAESTAKADPVGDQLTRIEAVLQSLSASQTEIGERLESVDERLGTVEKSTGLPNAAIIESTDQTQIGAGNAVSWEMDLNAPPAEGN